MLETENYESHEVHKRHQPETGKLDLHISDLLVTADAAADVVLDVSGNGLVLKCECDCSRPNDELSKSSLNPQSDRTVLDTQDLRN